MKLQTASITGVGSTDPIVMDTNKNPFNVGFGVITDGTVDYTVQHTFDNPFEPISTWFNHPTVAGQISDADGNYAFPVTAIRLTMNAGDGTATLKLIQAGVV